MIVPVRQTLQTRMFPFERIQLDSKPVRKRPALRNSVRRRLRQWEPLERRDMLASLPYGAMPDDTAEYMLGNVYVNVVFMESDSSLAPFDSSTENWTHAHRIETKQKIQDGLKWWQDSLAARNSVHTGQLNFVVDYQFADNPVRTGYEPITRRSNDFESWIYDFLDQVGYNSTGDFSKDTRAYNDAVRQSQGADWAFTLFVVNSDLDNDDAFAVGGSFSRAFSYAGGRFIVVPSGRPAATYAHEVGHMFWARDEYFGGGSYLDRRGYYNTQNLNAQDNPTPGFVHQNSIMSNGTFMDGAYLSHVNASPPLEMVGWRDSDGDGIFDMLDVPLLLEGSGYYQSADATYRFVGQARVQTLPNLNSSGLQNDISIARISRLEYRIDGSGWQVAASYATPTATIDVSIPVASGPHSVELRVIDTATGVTSPIFTGSTTAPSTALKQGINGTIYNDTSDDGAWDSGERGLPNWTVQLLDANGAALGLQKSFEPDDYPGQTDLRTVSPLVTFAALGASVDGKVGVDDSEFASTAFKVFQNNDVYYGWSSSWSQFVQLKATFATPVSTVQLDAIGDSAGDYGRLEAYNAQGQLLSRYTTKRLNAGAVESMVLTRPVADIAYVLAKGHVSTTVQFDNLRFGPRDMALTDAWGAYALTGLSGGTYRLQVTPPTNWSGDPISDRTLVLGEGESLGQIDFAAHSNGSPWQNPVSPFDVDDNNIIAALDALVLINALNSGKAGSLPFQGGPSLPPPFYDVNGDGKLLPIDVILVINHLNANRSGGESTDSGSPTGGGSTGGSGGGAGSGEFGGGEGERLAAQYASAGHVVVLRGDQPGRSTLLDFDVLHSQDCTCHNCTAGGEPSSLPRQAAREIKTPASRAGTSAAGSDWSPLENRIRSVQSSLAQSVRQLPLFAGSDPRFDQLASVIPAAAWDRALSSLLQTEDLDTTCSGHSDGSSADVFDAEWDHLDSLHFHAHDD